MSVEAEVPDESGRSASDLSEDLPSLPGVFIPDEKLAACEAAIGYSFSDRNILKHSLTHYQN